MFEKYGTQKTVLFLISTSFLEGEHMNQKLEKLGLEMSLPELVVARDYFQSLIDSQKNAETDRLLMAFIENIEKSGLSVTDVLAKLQPSQEDSIKNKVRKPARPKYRNPKDESQTWTGRGRKPHWVVAYLEAQGWEEVNKEGAEPEKIEANKEETNAILASILIEQP